MLNNPYFYFGTIRKMKILFGSLFNNLIIQRTDSTGNVTQQINVPLNYAQKESMMLRMMADPNIQKQAEVILPRISWFMDGMTFDENRMRAAMQQTTILNKPDITFQYSEVPYDFHFTLWVYAKNIEDGSKIIEQILPFFKPLYTVRAFLIPNRPSIDLPIDLKSLTNPDTDSEDFKLKQTLIWELHFTLKGYLYGPVQNGHIINLVNIQYYTGGGPTSNTINNFNFGISNNLINTYISNGVNNEYDKTITFQAGLNANSTPIPITTEDGNSYWLDENGDCVDYDIIGIPPLPLVVTYDEDWDLVTTINSIGGAN